MNILNPVDALLEHIKNVQLDVVSLSHDSLLMVSKYIEKNSLEPDEDIATALQYQDIITQQLHATIEAIESMRHSIKVFNHAYESDSNLANDSINKLQERLTIALEEAKDKKNRFSGKSAQEGEAAEMVEFF